MTHLLELLCGPVESTGILHTWVIGWHAPEIMFSYTVTRWNNITVKHSRRCRSLTVRHSGPERSMTVKQLVRSTTVKHLRHRRSITVKHSGRGRSLTERHSRPERSMTVKHPRPCCV